MTNITDLEPLSAFPKIKKLALYDLKLTAIGTIFKKFDDLLKLNLSNNAIESIENLKEMTEIV
jgi:Leucine-rich repeat (LRR) protein